MNPDQLKKLGVGLVVLLVVWVAASLFRRAGRDTLEGFHPAKLDRPSVTRMVIARPSDTVTLAKTGAEWTVNGLPAGADLVDQLLEAVSDTAATGELAAESKTSHERLGVDSAKAKRLRIAAGDKTLLTYLIGNRGSNWESVYLRTENDDRVFQVKSRLSEYADRQVDDWRDKKILAVEPDSVGGIDVGRGKASYSLERGASGWSLGAAPADSAAVAALLSQLKSFNASGFATQAQIDSAKFTPADRSLRVRGKGGQVLGALAFDSTSGGFWVRREGQATVFRVESWTADQVTPVDSTVRKK
jgi:hypothetical protein